MALGSDCELEIKMFKAIKDFFKTIHTHTDTLEIALLGDERYISGELFGNFRQLL